MIRWVFVRWKYVVFCFFLFLFFVIWIGISVCLMYESCYENSVNYRLSVPIYLFCSDLLWFLYVLLTYSYTDWFFLPPLPFLFFFYLSTYSFFYSFIFSFLYLFIYLSIHNSINSYIHENIGLQIDFVSYKLNPLVHFITH